MGAAGELGTLPLGPEATHVTAPVFWSDWAVDPAGQQPPEKGSVVFGPRTDVEPAGHAVGQEEQACNV